MNIILLGPPGAGKGTEGKLLAKEFNLKRLSVGALLRRLIKENSSIGKQIKEYVRQGLNVPANLLYSVLSKWFKQNRNNFIIDNFPRNEEQLELLKKLIKDNKVKIDKIFHINIPEKTSLKRLLERQKRRKQLGIQRIDESSAIIGSRYRVGYVKDIKKILDYFNMLGILEEINGEREIGVTHAEIMSRLGINCRERNGI